MSEAHVEPNAGARDLVQMADRLELATFGLARERPDLSAHRLLTGWRKLAIAGAFGVSIACAAAFPLNAAIAFNLAATAFFLVAIGFRLMLAFIGLREQGSAPAHAQTEDILPSVTILLPVHDEAEGLPILADAIGKIDYPARKLDIKLLLESTDRDTIDEARRLRLDRLFECVVVPEGGPKTKPKACNYGLQTARGELIVIYDAEDAPEPDQLRKAAAAFARGDPRLACVQARLNFYNANENFLTRGIMAANARFPPLPRRQDPQSGRPVSHVVASRRRSHDCRHELDWPVYTPGRFRAGSHCSRVRIALAV